MGQHSCSILLKDMEMNDMDKRKADIMLKFENQTMIAEYKEADKDDLKKRLDEYMQIAASMQEGKNGEGNQI